MSQIYVMENVDINNPGVTTFRGWTALLEVAKAYNDNHVNGTTTVKMVIRKYEDPDLTGIPERDASDNII